MRIVALITFNVFPDLVSAIIPPLQEGELHVWGT
jgi:hypothetical protein